MEKTGKSMRTVVLITAAVAAAALGIAAVIGLASGAFRTPTLTGAGALTVDETRDFPTTGVSRVDVTVVSEGVRITQSADERISIRYHGTVRGVRPDALPTLSAGEANGTLTIRILHWPRVGLGMLASQLSLDVALPRGYGKGLTVRTVSGDVEMADHGFTGLEVTTTSGDVRLQSMRAEQVSLRTTSGELTAAGLASVRSSLTTVSGEIDMRSMTGEVHARTTSGGVSLRYTAQPRAVEIDSTSGEVTLFLPPEAEFALDARSTSGSIRCDFPLTVSGGRGEHALSGKTGKGSAAVRLRTVSGEIVVGR